MSRRRKTLLKLYIPSHKGEGMDQWEKWWATERTSKLIEGFASDPIIGLMKDVMPPAAPILEAGCGPGYIVHLMREAGFPMVGIDFVGGSLVNGKSFDRSLPVIQGSVDKLPLADDSLGGYFSGGVIEHFEHGPDQVVQEAFRTLQPGGRMVIHFPCTNIYRRLISFFRQGPFRIGTWTATKQKTVCRTIPFNSDWVFFAYLYDIDDVDTILRSAGFKIGQKSRIGFVRGMYDIGIVRRILQGLQARYQKGEADTVTPDKRSVASQTPNSRIVSWARGLYEELSYDRLPLPFGRYLERILLEMFGHSAIFVCQKDTQ